MANSKVKYVMVDRDVSIEFDGDLVLIEGAGYTMFDKDQLATFRQLLDLAAKDAGWDKKPANPPIPRGGGVATMPADLFTNVYG